MHMPKTSEKYFAVDPWLITETGFKPEKNRLAESMFALANEYQCVRGYFEEGYSGDHLLGSYFNQLYDYMDFKYTQKFKGFVDKGAFMINAVDWLYTRIVLDGETLDLAAVSVSGFLRQTDMRDATMKREFTWTTTTGKSVKLTFLRFANAMITNMGCQKIVFEPLNFSGSVEIVSGLDFNTRYEIAAGWDQTKSTGAAKQNIDLNFWTLEKLGRDGGLCAIQARTRTSGMKLFSSFRLNASQPITPEALEKPAEKFIGVRFQLKLDQGKPAFFEKLAVSVWSITDDVDAQWTAGLALAKQHLAVTWDSALAMHRDFWKRAWDRMDIAIDGDPAVQQGVRFSVFMTFMNYHGEDEHKNVLCKLAGEVYQGVNFWDTEIYCERMYMFLDPEIARKLIMYRYHYLPQAMQDAKRCDLDGARYPFATVSGVDDSGCWQHCDLEIHQNVAIFYSIWHYVHVCQDDRFLHTYGIEILLQMCRCMASWGGWSPKNGDFGFYGVMGPDEFHMFVNNNCYTNVMGKKMFEYTVKVLEAMKAKAPKEYEAAVRKTGLKAEEPAEWVRMAKHMRIPKDEKTGIYEQHDGYFDLPHVDIANLPMSQIPIYKNWAYVKIFRFNMIKQPDFLNLPFFFSQDYSLEEKRINYEFYEARTIHESSMSPSLHSILAAEIGKIDDAYNFLAYASRLDLDNYNRNTEQGLHATASSGVWASMICGFGGMRSDGDVLILAPCIPEKWNSYSFKLRYRGSSMGVNVDRQKATFRVLEGCPVTVKLYGENRTVGSQPLELPVRR